MADYERQVAAQLGIAEILLAVREFSSGGFPKPRQVLGVGIVFAGLSVVQIASEPWQRLASTFGWLVVASLAITALSNSRDPAGKPFIDPSKPTVLSTVTQIPSSSAPLFPPQGPPA